MITFGQTLWMDQEHDKVWANGPGTLLQWTDRALMTDKTPEPQPAAEEGAGTPAATMAARKPAAVAKPAAPPKPKTRAGVPVVREGPDHDHLDRADGVQRPDDGYRGPPGRPAPTSSASSTPT